jgi:hypothetical protein
MDDDDEKFLLSVLVALSNIVAVAIAVVGDAKAPCILKGISVMKIRLFNEDNIIIIIAIHVAFIN